VTGYKSRQLGLDSQQGHGFFSSPPALRSTQPPVQWIMGLFVKDKVMNVRLELQQENLLTNLS
jgi:hypothetical protein